MFLQQLLCRGWEVLDSGEGVGAIQITGCDDLWGGGCVGVDFDVEVFAFAPCSNFHRQLCCFPSCYEVYFVEGEGALACWEVEDDATSFVNVWHRDVFLGAPVVDVISVGVHRHLDCDGVHGVVNGTCLQVHDLFLLTVVESGDAIRRPGILKLFVHQQHFNEAWVDDDAVLGDACGVGVDVGLESWEDCWLLAEVECLGE